LAKVLVLKMKKNLNKKAIKEAVKTKLQAVLAELSEISRKREKELLEMDRVAKMLVRRDLELSETREKREEEFKELEIKTKELEEVKFALINILEDVEEARRKAEEEKEKTLAIITNFVDGLLVFDVGNKLSLINPQVEIFFGVKAKDLTGKVISELSVFPLPTFQSLINLLGEEIRSLFREELIIRKNLILEVTTVPIIKEEEKLGTLVILHDITREKMIEVMKSEFVSIVAHQLRTPLSAVKWTLRMLLDEDFGEITLEQREYLEKTYLSNERMINLINDLLNVSRIEEGRYIYKPVLTNIENEVQFVLDSYKEEIDKKQIKFEFKKPKEKPPKVKVDVEKIRLAISNLLDNAIRYTLPGGRVILSLNRLSKEIEFSIKDTGVGIPEDQEGRVFTKFFRGINVIRMETEGSGLGLFITKNIIEAHGGKIWFETQEGKGTTFYFTLPTKEELREFLREL